MAKVEFLKKNVFLTLYETLYYILKLKTINLNHMNYKEWFAFKSSKNNFTLKVNIVELQLSDFSYPDEINQQNPHVKSFLLVKDET